jgi:hypothetical protein
MFPARGNFIYFTATDENFEFSADGNSFIPFNKRQQLHLTDEFDAVYLRATAGTPCRGTFIAGRGNGVSHFMAGDDVGNITTLLDDLLTATQAIRANTQAIRADTAANKATLDTGIPDILLALQSIQTALGNISVGVTSLTPYPTYAALRDAVTAGTPSAIISSVILAADPAPGLQTWQLLAAKTPGPFTAGDLARADDGVIVPADHNAAANNRLWYRVL